MNGADTMVRPTWFRGWYLVVAAWLVAPRAEQLGVARAILDVVSGEEAEDGAVPFVPPAENVSQVAAQQQQGKAKDDRPGKRTACESPERGPRRRRLCRCR